jgi:hypothetical protein
MNNNQPSRTPVCIEVRFLRNMRVIRVVKDTELNTVSHKKQLIYLRYVLTLWYCISELPLLEKKINRLLIQIMSKNNYQYSRKVED